MCAASMVKYHLAMEAIAAPLRRHSSTSQCTFASMAGSHLVVRAAAFVALGTAFVAVADLVTSYVDPPLQQLVARTLC